MSHREPVQNHCALCGAECGAAFGCADCYPVDEFTRAYREHERRHRPSNEERAAYFAANDTDVPAQIREQRPTRLALAKAWAVYALFFVVLPIVGGVHAWVYATWKEWRK